MDELMKILAERVQATLDTQVPDIGALPMGDTANQWRALFNKMNEDIDLGTSEEQKRIGVGLVAAIEMLGFYQHIWMRVAEENGEDKGAQAIAFTGVVLMQSITELLAAGIIEVIERVDP